MCSILIRTFNNPKCTENFQKFFDSCIFEPKNIQKVKYSLSNAQKILFSKGEKDVFTNNLEFMATNLPNKSYQNVRCLLKNQLVKIFMYYREYDKAEYWIKESIKEHRKNNDYFHVYARLDDLEKIYTIKGDRKNLYKILEQKKKITQSTISNYEFHKQNFHTIHIQPTSLREIKKQKAFVYLKLSNLITSKPQDKIKCLEKAIEIFEEINCKDEVEIYTMRLKKLKQETLRKRLLFDI